MAAGVDCVRRLSVVVFQLLEHRDRKVLVDLTVGSKRKALRQTFAFPVWQKLLVTEEPHNSHVHLIHCTIRRWFGGKRECKCQ